MQNWLYSVLALTWLLANVAWAGTIHVAAAISLKEALPAIAQSYQAQGGGRGDEIVFAFGSSGQLAAQIKYGADIDVFISAANQQVDELAKDGLVDGAMRQVVARNSLVLVVPAKATNPPGSFEALGDAGVQKIAIGDPKTVPAGDYAMQVLSAVKVAEKLRDRIVYGINVRQVLTYVENGEVSAGIVYATDARESGDKVKVVATAQADTHQSIDYPAVVIKASKHEESAAKFLAYFRTEQARNILAEKGFIVDEAVKTTAATKAAAK